MMVAGEASGDQWGGALAEALRERDPSIQMIGLGGSVMRRHGVKVLFDIEQLAVVGLFEVLSKIKPIWSAYRLACRLLKDIDLLVLIDAPDFNLRLAKVAKQAGIKVVYYVSPQVWAWRPNRIWTIAKRVDQMMVLFPWEEEIYRKAGLPCQWVGHPLVDEWAVVEATHFDREAYLSAHGLNPSDRTIGLLPGSRESEVKALLPAMIGGIALLAKKIPGLQAMIPMAPSLPKQTRQFIINLAASSSTPIAAVEGDIYAVLRASDVTVVASGTATLQAALTATPMVIVYRLSSLTYAIAKRWVTRPIGLPNIVCKTALIPELIQSDAAPEPICYELERLLVNRTEMDRMKRVLHDVASGLGHRGVSGRAADLVLKQLPA